MWPSSSHSGTFRAVRRLVTVAILSSVLCLAVGAGGAFAHPGPGPAALAQFRACMKDNGAPAPGRIPRGGKPSADQIAAWKAAWKKAFEACRQLLPARPARRGGFPHFALPTAAQVTAFKDCMATHGFARGKPGTVPRPNLRDKSVRQALGAALVACWPLLQPKPSS